MKKAKCETCEYKGYSAEICKYHSTKDGSCDEPDPDSRSSLTKIGKAVVLGAGAGLAATFTGIAVAPVIGLKSVVGHAIAAKITAGGGVAGVGVSVARKIKKQTSKSEPAKRKPILLPKYRKG